MSRNRKLLAQLLKSWAAEHDRGYQIADPDPGDQGILNTGQFLSWILKEGSANLNLIGLLDKLETFVDSNKKSKFDGMFCKNCNEFHSFAESDSSDGSFTCYSCKVNPFY